MSDKAVEDRKTVLDMILQYKAFQPDWEHQLEKTIKDLTIYLPKDYLPSDLTQIPRNHILDLYPFFEKYPQKYYKEDIFIFFIDFHLNFFNTYNDIQSVFADVNTSLTEGWFKLNLFNKEVAETNLDNLPREKKFRTYILPWYAHRLCEDIYDSLLSLPLKSLGKERNKKYLQLSTNKKINDILKQDANLAFLTHFYNPIIRNASSHPSGQIKFLKKNQIHFINKKDDELLYDSEVIEIFEDLLDTCNAMAFATKILQIKFFDKLKTTTMQPVHLEDSLKEEFLKKEISSHMFWIEGIDVVEMPSNRGKQLNLDCRHRILRIEETIFEAFRSMVIVNKYFPNVDFIFVGLKSKGQTAWIRAKTKNVKRWVSGEITDEEFFKVIMKDAFFYPLRSSNIFIRIISSLRRFWPILIENFKKEYQNQLRQQGLYAEEDWKILDLQDSSIRGAKRFLVTLLVKRGTSKASIKGIIGDVTREVTKKERANYVWILVFDKEKRPRDMYALDELPYFICRSEYYDKSRDDLAYIHADYDEEYKGIRVKWSTNFT